jgi:hypothetical protein
MWPFTRNAEAQEQQEETRTISACDDLLTRAENIVWIMGYRGAVGNFVLNVHHLLREYERADQERAAIMNPACSNPADIPVVSEGET